MKKIWALLFLLLTLPLFASKKIDALFTAVEEQSADELTALLKKSGDVVNATRGKNKETLLMVAVAKNREKEVIAVLLGRGADVTLKTKSGVTALMIACQYETDPSVIENIIRADAIRKKTWESRVLQKDKEQKCAFDYALHNPRACDVISVLEKYAKNPLPEALMHSLQAKQDENAAEPAALDTPEIAENAIFEKSENEAQAESPVTELSAAPEQAVASLEPESEKSDSASATVPAVQEPEIEPLVYTPTYLFDYAELDDEETAVASDSIDEYRLRHTFIENPDARDTEGRTLLMKAVRDGNEELFEDLLYSEADIQAQDNDGWTALMFASRFQNNAAIVRRLLSLGADATKKNNYGLTALSLAAGFAENPEVVAELLKNHTAAERDVRAAFIYAITMESSTDTLALFIEKGISLNAPHNGKTPLMYAAETNTNTHIISWLLKHGAKTTYKTSGGKTAFDFAQANLRLPHNEVYWALNAANGGR